MSKPPPYLTADQQKLVLIALSTLRLSGHDRFLLDLSSALAHCPHQPVRDLDVKIAIRQLIGIVPAGDIVNSEADASC